MTLYQRVLCVRQDQPPYSSNPPDYVHQYIHSFAIQPDLRSSLASWVWLERLIGTFTHCRTTQIRWSMDVHRVLVHVCYNNQRICLQTNVVLPARVSALLQHNVYLCLMLQFTLLCQHLVEKELHDCKIYFYVCMDIHTYL